MAGIAVALIDYHLFDDRVPPRGRIFNNQGLQIQAGRFDLSFGIDYQNFANKDRVTVTVPLTTSRMQLGVELCQSWFLASGAGIKFEKIISAPFNNLDRETW